MGSSSLDLISILYDVKRKQREDFERKDNVFWVTDLVRCPLKREYELSYPELAMSELFSPAAIMGDLVHLGLERLLSERLGSPARVEVEGARNISLPDGREVEVRGRCDLIVDTGGERVGVEIKTSRSDSGLPREHHMDQARLYNWLFNLSTALILYITPERIAQYVVQDRASDEEVVQRITSRSYPRYLWECRYCTYSVLCPYKKT